MRRNFRFWQFFLQVYIRSPVSDFVILKLYVILDELILFVKVIFVAKYSSSMVFGGGILGGACKLWGNHYLNSTIVLFDTKGLASSWRIRIVYI